MNDFKQQADGDIDISTNDLLVVNATLQHSQDLILTRQGSLKLAPATGVGIEDYFNDDSKEAMLRKIRQQHQRDGFVVREMRINNDNIDIIGYYETDFNT